jgi:hypothetical protein
MRAHHELEITPQLLGWGTKKAFRPTEAQLLPQQDPKTGGRAWRTDLTG